MKLLFDIGNTHTHLGLANYQRVIKQGNIPTQSWSDGKAARLVQRFVGKKYLEGAALCSVVPKVTPEVLKFTKRNWNLDCLQLTPKTICGVGIDYPKPNTIGP